MDYITIATFINPIEFHIAKGLLAQAGIEVLPVSDGLSNIAHAMVELPMIISEKDQTIAAELLPDAQFI